MSMSEGTSLYQIYARTHTRKNNTRSLQANVGQTTAIKTKKNQRCTAVACSGLAPVCLTVHSKPGRRTSRPSADVRGRAAARPQRAWVASGPEAPDPPQPQRRSITIRRARAAALGTCLPPCGSGTSALTRLPTQSGLRRHRPREAGSLPVCALSQERRPRSRGRHILLHAGRLVPSHDGGRRHRVLGG